MGHGHSHEHHHGEGGHHHHAPIVTSENMRRVAWAAVLTGLFVGVEVAGGLISGSLALLADAGHMVTDFAALAMAWVGFRIAQKPATAAYPFGFDRFPILVAFVNGLTLFGVAGWIVVEAIQRLAAPGDVLAGPMFWVAVAGLSVNLIVFWILMGADRDNLNIRGAVLHVMGDLLGSAAAIVAALVILATGWVMVDPILSVLVAVLILRSAWGLVRDSARVLMQAAPSDTSHLREKLDAIEGLHIERFQLWTLTPERPVAALSVKGDDAAMAALRYALEHHGVDDVTIERL